MNRLQANNQKNLPKDIYAFLAQSGNEEMRKACQKLCIWFGDTKVTGGFFVDNENKKATVLEVGELNFEINSFGDIRHLDSDTEIDTRGDLKKALNIKSKRMSLHPEWRNHLNP